MEVLVNVINQKLRLASNMKRMVAGTQEFVRFVFNFYNNDWEELTTFAQFIQNGRSYNVFLDSENSVYLPSEITEGKAELVLRGSNENVIAITDNITLTISDNILIEDADSTLITPSLFDQLVTMIAEVTSHYPRLGNDDIIDFD